jgi:hypothetical protein
MAKARGVTPQVRANLRPSAAPKQEPKSRAVDVSSLGINITAKGEGRYEIDGPGYHGAKQMADGVKAVGVGGGRTVLACGTQGTHGPAAPGHHGAGLKPMSRGLLEEFGPESPAASKVK